MFAVSARDASATNEPLKGISHHPVETTEKCWHGDTAMPLSLTLRRHREVQSASPGLPSCIIARLLLLSFFARPGYL